MDVKLIVTVIIVLGIILLLVLISKEIFQRIVGGALGYNNLSISTRLGNIVLNYVRVKNEYQLQKDIIEKIKQIQKI